MKTEFLTDLEKIRQRARDESERGPVQSGYAGELKYMVELLSEALSAESLCSQHLHELAELALRWNARSLAQDFEEHAQAEESRVAEISRRIKQLGGAVNLPRSICCEAGHVKDKDGDSLASLVQEELEAERVAAETCEEIASRLAEFDPDTCQVLKGLRQCEEEHKAHLARLLAELQSVLASEGQRLTDEKSE